MVVVRCLLCVVNVFGCVLFWCLLFVVCDVLFVFVVRCVGDRSLLLFVVCVLLLSVVQCLLFVICCLVFGVWCFGVR